MTEQARIRNEDDTPEGVPRKRLQEDQEWLEINKLMQAQVALVQALLQMAGSKEHHPFIQRVLCLLQSVEELLLSGAG